MNKNHVRLFFLFLISFLAFDDCTKKLCADGDSSCGVVTNPGTPSSSSSSTLPGGGTDPVPFNPPKPTPPSTTIICTAGDPDLFANINNPNCQFPTITDYCAALNSINHNNSLNDLPLTASGCYNLTKIVNPANPNDQPACVHSQSTDTNLSTCAIYIFDQIHNNSAWGCGAIHDSATFQNAFNDFLDANTVIVSVSPTAVGASNNTFMFPILLSSSTAGQTLVAGSNLTYTSTQFDDPTNDSYMVLSNRTPCQLPTFPFTPAATTNKGN